LSRGGRPTFESSEGNSKGGYKVERAKAAIVDLNGRWHEVALLIFMAGIAAHMAEHVTQAIQIYGLGNAIPDSRGIAGQWFPWLAKSESLHYFYAIYTLLGLVLLAPAFQGRARFWWMAALGFQFWHHLEHVTLLYQRVTGDFFFGEAVPTSIVQVLVPRVELHLTYNTLVFIPIVIALFEHYFPAAWERLNPICGCSRRSRQAAPASASQAS
jgi:hypothetical protein